MNFKALLFMQSILIQQFNINASCPEHKEYLTLNYGCDYLYEAIPI